MRTEADPPLPVYSRDYMDAVGLEYWNGTGNGDGDTGRYGDGDNGGDDGDDNERQVEAEVRSRSRIRRRRREWNVIRYCMEEGTRNGGRQV